VRTSFQHVINRFDDSLQPAVSGSSVKPFCGKSNDQLRVNPDHEEFRVIFGSDFLGNIDLEVVATVHQRALQFLYVVGVKPIANDSDIELIRFELRSLWTLRKLYCGGLTMREERHGAPGSRRFLTLAWVSKYRRGSQVTAQKPGGNLGHRP